MSRIDEALRRSAMAPVVELNRHAGSEAATGLDVYPVENLQPVEDAKPSPPAARHREVFAAGELLAGARTAAAPALVCGAGMEGKLITTPGLAPMAIEQYRRLAAAMHEHQVERGLKILMVTSAVPAEGKTLTVVNLALTLSDSFQRRVLLIDADLRRPSLHEVFRLPNAVGLSQVLQGATDSIPMVARSSRLSVLPAGQPDGNQMAGLTSPRMMALLEQASARFDWVLLDAPPVLLMPDAQLLAREAGAVIFVIKAGATPFATVNKAVSGLGRDYIVGTVLNRVEAEALPATEGYYRYYEHAAAE